MSYNKKSLGQNFLIDKNVIKKIINTVLVKGKDIIEIGPGDGALTDQIIKLKPKSLVLIEKDIYLSSKLKLKYKYEKTINVISGDFLKLDLKKIIKKNSIIFGNLPYNVSSQILIKLVKNGYWPPKYKDLILMFQKELGEKIIADFTSPKYGRLSIITAVVLDLKKKFIVSPNCFKPKPKVQSLVLHFKSKKKRKTSFLNIENLEKVTNILFSNKRKMINKNLKKILTINEIYHLKDIELDMRPNDVKPETYYKITEIIERRKYS